MLNLNILKNVVIVGQEYKAGDVVKVNKTLIHKEVQKVKSGIQVLLDAGLIEADAEPNTYKVLGDVTINVVGQEFKKDDVFVASKAFDYVDITDYPSWVAEGVTKGLWAMDAIAVHPTSVKVQPAGTFKSAVGVEYTLGVNVQPQNTTDKTGVWSSSDATVATISAAGVVMPLKAGSSTFTFKANDGGLSNSTVGTFTVPDVLPTSVNVSPASPTTTVGNTVKLSAAITPAGATDKTGVWSSATPAVATVAQDGTVTGVTEGTSVITFTTNTGNKSANRTVTVGPAA